MKKILIAVDDTKGAKNALTMCGDVCSCMRPETIVLLYVERFEGRTFMAEMVGDAELKTLKDVLKGTEYKEALDKKANDVLNYYKKALEDKGLSDIKTVIKSGHPVFLNFIAIIKTSLNLKFNHLLYYRVIFSTERILESLHFFCHFPFRPPVEELDTKESTENHSCAVYPSVRVTACRVSLN